MIEPYFDFCASNFIYLLQQHNIILAKFFPIAKCPTRFVGHDGTQRHRGTITLTVLFYLYWLKIDN